jgi:hypothetical protein
MMILDSPWFKFSGTLTAKNLQLQKAKFCDKKTSNLMIFKGICSKKKKTKINPRCA